MGRIFVVNMLALALGLLMAARPAAAEGPFTVSGIKVDASAASSVGARNAAIDSGRVRAWQVLFRRITRQADWPRQPQLSHEQLQRLINSYYPQNEMRSTTRYVAEVTYIFNPGAVAKLLQGHNIAYTVAAAKRVLVIPLNPGYARSSRWTAALGNPRFAGGLVPFVVPIGDGADMGALSAIDFETANWNDVAAVAARLQASEAVLALAMPVGNMMAVSLRRIGPRQLPVKAGTQVRMLQDAAGTYPSAADAAVEAMEDLWKSHVALDYGRKGTMTVEVHTNSLTQWAAVQTALTGVPNVAEIAIQAMDIGMTRLTLTYLGSVEQLREALERGNLALRQEAGGVWQLSPTDAFAMRTP